MDDSILPRFLRSEPYTSLHGSLRMENWIGIAIWIVLGAVIGLAMKGLVRVEDEKPGHTTILAVLGAFAGLIGGMLGVGIFEFFDPRSLSLGGMAGAVFLPVLFTFIYRWGIRGLT